MSTFPAEWTVPSDEVFERLMLEAEIIEPHQTGLPILDVTWEMADVAGRSILVPKGGYRFSRPLSMREKEILVRRMMEEPDA